MAADLYKEDYCAVYINWKLPPGRWDKIGRMHWHVTREVWRKRKCYALLSGLVWPLKALLSAVRMTALHGATVRERRGIGLLTQFLQQIPLALRHFITPRGYYFYGLHDPENRRRARLYIQDHEIGFLLKSANGNVDYRAFEDKRRFVSVCKRNGLPTIDIIADFEKGRMRWWSELESLPEADLFAKPAMGRCANGVILYKYVSPNVYIGSAGVARSGEKVLDELSNISEREPYILQRRLVNHPDISAFSPCGLCTSRVVTWRPPDGGCEEIIAIFKMPTGSNFADNFSIGGIAVSIDKKSGVLGSAQTKYLGALRTEFHPGNGRKIAGFRIPFWREGIRLCLDAHAVYPAYAFVGWDVAFTAEGPILVEGNLEWGVESLQRAHYGPLGETFFPEAVLARIEQTKRGGMANTGSDIPGGEIARMSQPASGDEELNSRHEEALR